MQSSIPEISKDRRYKLICIPWLVTTLATFPGILFGPHLLPAGLYRLFGVRENQMLEHGWWLGLGWLVYIALSVGACLSRRERTYFIVYVVLCLLLALNCVGCRAFWSDFSRIH
jgi:hypothetical protein